MKSYIHKWRLYQWSRHKSSGYTQHLPQSVTLVGTQQMPISSYSFHWGLWHMLPQHIPPHKAFCLDITDVSYDASTFFGSFCNTTYILMYLPSLSQTASTWYPGHSKLSVPSSSLASAMLSTLPARSSLPNSYLTFPSWPRHWFSRWLSYDAYMIWGLNSIMLASRLLPPLKQASMTCKTMFCSLFTEVSHLMPGTHMIPYSSPHRI